MRIQESSSVKFYNLSGGSNKSLPSWLSPEQRAKLLRDEKFSEGLVLLQDYEMPEASQKIKISRDLRYLFVSGVYKPSCKVFEVAELSVKFERFFDEETVDFEILTDDYAKVCYLGATGNLFFHAKYGQYYTAKLPCVGRCLKYDRATCDLFAVGSSPEIWRLNLEAGRYLEPIVSEFEAINVVGINPVHSLLAFGGTGGVFECRDPRCPASSPIARVNVGQQLASAGEVEAGQEFEITALEFCNDGLQLGIGTETGHSLLFDLRSPNPMFVKDHRNELPVHSVRFHKDHFVSVDSKVIKIFDKTSGAQFANLETDAPSSDVVLWPDSGLFLVTGERPQCMAYYCPTLGPAPRWCSFLDNITEELEDRRSLNGDEIYENYKFLTRDDLAKIGGESLIGTKYLRRYMHGFFISTKLYKQMRSATTSWSDDLKRVKERKEQSQLENRITLDESKTRKAKPAQPTEPDRRFAAMKDNPDFAVDERFVAMQEEGSGEDDEESKVRLFEVRDDEEEDGVMFAEGKRDRSEKNRKLGERAADAEKTRGGKKKSRVGGALEYSFVPSAAQKDRAKKREEKKQRMEKNKTRRKAGRFFNK